jgi:hypothetical protein
MTKIKQLSRHGVLFVFLFSSFILSQINLHPQLLMEESFDSLERWQPLYFDNIDRYSTYEIADGVLTISSNNSASGIIFDTEFALEENLWVEWTWKVEDILQGGDAARKSGDDYAVRIYILFPYDPQAVGFWERAAFEAAKLIYGEYPPMATLNFIWSNKVHEDEILVNPFTDRAMMIPLDQGDAYVNEWRTHRINISEYYRLAFAKEVPKRFGIAIMGDSDNTGESSLAYIDFIRVFRD